MPIALGEEAVAELAGESAGDGATDGVVEGPISVDPGIASPVPWQDANTSTTAIHPRDRTRHIVVLPRPRLGVRCTQSAFRARAPARAPRWMTLCAVDRFSEVSARCLSRCRAASAGALRRLARSGAPACPAATIAAGPPGIGIRALSAWAPYVARRSSEDRRRARQPGRSLREDAPQRGMDGRGPAGRPGRLGRAGESPRCRPGGVGAGRGGRPGAGEATPP